MNIFCIRPRGLNIGNDVIYLAMKYFLERTLGFRPNIISIAATSRYETTVRAGLTAATIHEINQYGDGVIVGGGNLYENNEIDLDPNALKALEVPLFLFSLSRGRIYNRQNRLVTRTDCMPDEKILALHRAACVSSARDRATKEYMDGIGCPDVVLCGCPTIFIDRMGVTLPPLAPSQQGLALVSVRTPHLMNIPLEKQARIPQDVRDIVAFLTEQGASPILLCHDQRDIPFAASFPGVEYLYFDDVYKYLAILKEASVDVSYRLHATLPALAFGVPSIKLSYDERALSLMETLGYGDWQIDITRADNVRDAVAARYAQMPTLQALREQNRPLLDGYYGVIEGLFGEFVRVINTRGQ
ncbi:polysaccharide pyruvyl transferase family protein [Chloroflexota bacterium]